MIFKNNKILIALLFLLSADCGVWTSESPAFISTDSLSLIDEIGSKDSHKWSWNGQKSTGIVFVIDTSYSMVRHLQRVPQTFKNFIPALQQLKNWQMMFTNTDYNPNRESIYYSSNLLMGQAMPLEWQSHVLPHKILYSHSKEKQQIFLDTLKRYEQDDFSHPHNHPYINPCELPPFCQGRLRNPIPSLVQAFLANREFFNSATHLVAIIWTNGDNMDNTTYQKSEVVPVFQKIHGTDKTLTVYSISIIPGDASCLNYDRKHFSPYRFTESAVGHEIHNLVRLTKGKTMNICDSDYSPLAKAIARQHQF